MREKSRAGVPPFALTADVSEARCQIPIAERAWHFLGCQVVPGGPVFINTVGTFGVASASYFWSRVATVIGRLSQHMASRSAHTWHVLVADDFHLDAAGANYPAALLHFCTLCATANVPLSWGKTARGVVVSWMVFELLHRTRMLGITQRRADWLTKWSREVAAAPVVNLASFEEGLGRVMCVVSALEYERPFLAPLYRFMTMHPRGSTRRVPAYLRSFWTKLPSKITDGPLSFRFSSVDSNVFTPSGCTSQWRLDRSGRMVASLGRTRKRCPEKVVAVLVGSPSRGFSVGFRLRQETGTDHLDSGGARSATVVEALRGAPTRGTATTSDHPSHLDPQQGWMICTEQADDCTLPLVRARHGGSCRDEKKLSEGAGRMDTEVVQPWGRLFGERGHEPVQSGTRASCGTSHAEVARPRLQRKRTTEWSGVVGSQTGRRSRNGASRKNV